MKIDVIQLEIKKIGSLDFENATSKFFGVQSSGLFFTEQIGYCNVEKVEMLCIGSQNEVINYSIISMGNMSNVNVSLAQIAKTALLSNSSKVVIAHNHPSGKLEITPQDISLTKKIGSALKLFSIELLDSLIVTFPNKFISIREHFNELQ